jgi:uncharacterized protein YjbJ (UPF0337 family)
MEKQRDKIRIRSAANQVKGSKKDTAAKVTGAGKLGAKANAEKALGKGQGRIGSKKDKLSNDFTT